MRLTRLELANYRSFAETSLSFEPGVSVIHGDNGAGKTTLLESVLFALYGARALDDATLADIITHGEDEATVQLSFVHGGGEYHLVRELAVSGERASTRRAELATPDGERHEGAEAVRTSVADMLRMDAEAFVNSAYVKQGEINKLLHATPAERQSMIDELLQLGRLENYRDRADDARLAVRSMVRERGEVIDELERQRERLVDPDPYDRLNDLESTLEALDARERELETRREEHAATVDELEERRSRLAEQHERYDELEGRRRELTEALDELADRRQTVRDELAEARTEHREARERRGEHLDALSVADGDEIADELEAVDETIESVEAEIDEHRETVEAARERAATATERVSALDERIEDHEAELASVTDQLEEDDAVLDERRERVATLERELEAAIEDLDVEAATAEALATAAQTLDDRIEDLREKLRVRRDERAAVAEHIEQAESLAAEDRCPTCGQPVDESPHVDALDTERERLEAIDDDIDELEAAIETAHAQRSAVESARESHSELDRQRELLAEREDVLEERRQRRETLEAAIEEATAEREDATAAADAAQSAIADAREAIASANERLQTLRNRRQDLVAAQEAIEAVSSAEEAIERLEERQDHLDELETERRDQLDAVADELAELETALADADVETVEHDLAEAREALSTTEAQLSDLREERDEVTETLGSVRADIERLEAVEADLEDARTRRDDLASLRDEVADLGGLYETVRADLRERNVATLEVLLNETFELLYRNDAYEHIDLDEDYALTVHGTDGTELDPSQLSGGERAIFNLSLRCAIYRLVAEGVEGSAPMPPLMLDEPTVFLDSGHVERLIRLLETMREFGVEQTLVVSHHESLLAAAEHRIGVEKDPSSNRSTVRSLAAVGPPG